MAGKAPASPCGKASHGKCGWLEGKARSQIPNIRKKGENEMSIRNVVKRDTAYASALAYPTKVQRLLAKCGVRMTALYLKNRGYTAEQAVTLMFK